MLYPNGTTTRPVVSSPYGPRTGGAFAFHYGADLIGFTRIHAVTAGLVVFAGWMNNNAGNTIIIAHPPGVTSVYMHNDSHQVHRGDHVTEGQQIGVMGRTGNATGDCNHLEIRVRGTPLEPLTYITARLPTPTRTTPAPPTITEKEDEGMFINIQGHAGTRHAGAYYIAAGRATFLGAPVPDLPTLPTAHATQLATRVTGIPHNTPTTEQAPAPATTSGTGDTGGVVGVYGPNPFGIPFTGGLQKIARLYGYQGPLDHNFGAGSMAGFAQFLRTHWGYEGNDTLGPIMWAAIARWLRTRWGYEGNDTPGPAIRAALNRADTANWNQL